MTARSHSLIFNFKFSIFNEFSKSKTSILNFSATTFTGDLVIVCFFPTGLSGCVATSFTLIGSFLSRNIFSRKSAEKYGVPIPFLNPCDTYDTIKNTFYEDYTVYAQNCIRYETTDYVTDTKAYVLIQTDSDNDGEADIEMISEESYRNVATVTWSHNKVNLWCSI